jgi:hypothetical protein
MGKYMKVIDCRNKKATYRYHHFSNGSIVETTNQFSTHNSYQCQLIKQNGRPRKAWSKPFNLTGRIQFIDKEDLKELTEKEKARLVAELI